MYKTPVQRNSIGELENDFEESQFCHMCTEVLGCLKKKKRQTNPLPQEKKSLEVVLTK